MWIRSPRSYCKNLPTPITSKFCFLSAIELLSLHRRSRNLSTSSLSAVSLLSFKGFGLKCDGLVERFTFAIPRSFPFVKNRRRRHGRPSSSSLELAESSEDKTRKTGPGLMTGNGTQWRKPGDAVTQHFVIRALLRYPHSTSRRSSPLLSLV